MDFVFDGPEDAKITFIFAHGAGGAMDTPWMTNVAQAIAARGIRVARFEFPYMAARRTGKKSGAPDRQPVLLDAYRAAIDALGGGERVFIGGKSLGGRMATMVADDASVRGVICFGYPFHPPGRPQQLRTAHLETIRTPVLVIQGTRDPFGTAEEVCNYPLAPAVRLVWMEDGDHSLKPRAASGYTERAHLVRAAGLATDWMTQFWKSD